MKKSKRGPKQSQDDEIYVHRLMKASCSCGSMDNYLNIKTDHGVLAGEDQQPLMNANDHIAGENVIHFGNCNSNKNPERVFRTLLVGSLLGPLTSVILAKTGIMSFKCTPKTDEVWEETNENNILEGAPALLTKSCLTCRYGGVIIIVPEDELKEEEQKKGDEDTSEEKRNTVQEETDAILAAAMDRISATGAAGDKAVKDAQMSMIAAAAATAEAAAAVTGSYNSGESGGNSWTKALTCPLPQINDNYQHNLEVPFAGPFLDSNNMIVDQTLMGDFRINNFTVDKVGCGSVAVYNAFQLLQPDNAPSFADIIQSMEPYGFLNNQYGIMPCGIADQFIGAGFEVSYEVLNIGERMKESTAGIIGFATQNSTHFVTCKSVDGEEMQFFNLPNGLDKTVKTFSEFTEQMKDLSAFAFMGMTISEKSKAV